MPWQWHLVAAALFFCVSEYLLCPFLKTVGYSNILSCVRLQKQLRYSSRRFWQIWLSPEINLAKKTHLLNSIIIPTAIYAWRTSAKITKTLSVAQQRWLRRILRVAYRDHVTNDKVHRWTAKHPLHDTVTQWHMRFGDHILRQLLYRLPKIAITWNPLHGRHQGVSEQQRQRTFIDDLRMRWGRSSCIWPITPAETCSPMHQMVQVSNILNSVILLDNNYKLVFRRHLQNSNRGFRGIVTQNLLKIYQNIVTKRTISMFSFELLNYCCEFCRSGILQIKFPEEKFMMTSPLNYNLHEITCKTKRAGLVFSNKGICQNKQHLHIIHSF